MLISSQSRFFSDQEAQTLMLGYNGSNMTWKGYVRNLAGNVQSLANAVGYLRPSTPETKALQRCAKILNMLDRSVTIWYNSNMAGEHMVRFERTSIKYMSTIDDKSKRRTSINTDFDSDVELRGLENREFYSRPIRSIHHCMVDIVRASTALDFWEDLLQFSNRNSNLEEIRYPQRRGLIRQFNILEDLFLMVDHQYQDACLDTLDRKLWGLKSLNEDWVDLKNRLDFTGWIMMYPHLAHQIVDRLAVNLKYYKGYNYTKPFLEKFSDPYITAHNAEEWWIGFKYEIDRFFRRHQAVSFANDWRTGVQLLKEQQAQAAAERKRSEG